jgi:hypothetical protein
VEDQICWRRRQQHQRTGSLRRKPALRDPYARLDNDDAGYSRGVDDWHSDYDDDDDLDRPTPVKALVADAVRYATGKGTDSCRHPPALSVWVWDSPSPHSHVAAPRRRWARNGRGEGKIGMAEHAR